MFLVKKRWIVIIGIRLTSQGCEQQSPTVYCTDMPSPQCLKPSKPRPFSPESSCFPSNSICRIPSFSHYLPRLRRFRTQAFILLFLKGDKPRSTTQSLMTSDGSDCHVTRQEEQVRMLTALRVPLQILCSPRFIRIGFQACTMRS